VIAIVDYGMGNLRSVQKALQRVGGDARIVQRPADVDKAEKVVVPGVGAFADAVARLRERGLAEAIRGAVAADRPFLGICLGLQMLFDVSYEDGEHAGLGIVAGEVIRFRFGDAPAGQAPRVPHMGWNRIRWSDPCPLLAGLDDGAYAYFAHSYHVVPADEGIGRATTTYGYPFTSAIWRGSLFGTQFHPEKSQAVGLKILENFVRL
jgi:glutamine amidotransferase